MAICAEFIIASSVILLLAIVAILLLTTTSPPASDTPPLAPSPDNPKSSFGEEAPRCSLDDMADEAQKDIQGRALTEAIDGDDRPMEASFAAAQLRRIRTMAHLRGYVPP